MAFFRAYSGKLDAGSYIYNSRTGTKSVSLVFIRCTPNKQNAIDVVEAGDICAAVGFKDIKTGDTLRMQKHPIVLESMVFPRSSNWYAVEPKTKADVDKLGMALLNWLRKILL